MVDYPVQALEDGISVDAGNDTAAVSLLHFDGTDASTTITDSAPSPRTWTATGNAQIDTAQSKFGGASALFDGAGDYILGDGNSAFAFGTGDFTVDFWLRPAATTGFIMDFRPSAAAGVNMYLWFSGNKIVMGNGLTDRITSATTPSTSAFSHLAIIRLAGVTRMFFNGAQEGVNYIDATSYVAATSRPIIGIARDVSTGPYSGHIDELRISNIARWNGPFTPPAYAYGG